MINIFVALKAEARPLVRRFGLAPETTGRFQSFHSDRMGLTVTGVGESAARQAVEMGAERRYSPAPCLNVGIAGHGGLPVGTPLLIHKVTERATGDTHYPAFPFSPPCGTTPLVTVSTPETNYPEECAYDMEGAGFFAAAVALSGCELAHALKVVSDNPREPVTSMSAPRVEELLERHLDLIEHLAELLIALARPVVDRRRDPPLFGTLLQRYHFTHTQRHQLHRLLQRWQALAPDQPDEALHFPLHNRALRSGGDVLSFLEKHVDHLSFSLS